MLLGDTPTGARAATELARLAVPVGPVLAVEVLSPSGRLVDLNLKRAAYERMGTASYWRPVFHALCEAERALEVLLVNARHVKNVPGRTSDALDAVWLAELTECGLPRGGFIPPKEIAAIWELTRYRKKLIEQRSSELQRLAKGARRRRDQDRLGGLGADHPIGAGHDRGVDQR